MGGATRPDLNGDVTLIARHRVRSGQEQAFFRWVHSVVTACRTFDGYRGTEVIRPSTRGGDEHVCIVRFESFADLDRWMNSDEHARWIERADAFSAAPTEIDRYHALQHWFPSRPSAGSSSAPPSPHKMALVTLLVIWPLVHVIPGGIASVLPVHPLAVEGVSVMVIVALMTYLLMPMATTLLRGVVVRVRWSGARRCRDPAIYGEDYRRSSKSVRSSPSSSCGALPCTGHAGITRSTAHPCASITSSSPWVRELTAS